MKTKSPIHSHISGRNAAALSLTNEQVTDQAISDLSSLGICFDSADISRMQQLLEGPIEGLGLDSDLTPGLTQTSITTPVQFAQAWLPGIVRIVTSPRKIDRLIGITTQGDWADEEIVQSLLGNSGEAVPYTDDGNIPLANWNLNFVRRTIVRFEMGLKVGILEQERGSKVRVASAEEKRYGCSEALEIIRNKVGFFGYNDGDNNTYGYLNDPQLLAYNTLPDPGAGTEWAVKSYLEIVEDLIFMAAGLQNQSDGRIDPKEDDICLAIPTEQDQYLNKTTDFGAAISVRSWIKQTYPNWRVETAPQLKEANGAENVAYLFAERVDMSGTDDAATFIQVVPTKFRTLGVMQTPKGYIEDYSNATAGSLNKRPYAVFRSTGL